VRQLKADLLHQMAYRSTESIARAFLMREALALEGKVTIPRLIPSSPEIIAQSPDTFVDYFREADYHLKLDSESWAALYLSSTDLGKTIAEGKVKLTKGSPEEVAAVLGLFDKFAPGKNYKIPPREDEQKKAGGHES
jgi:alkyl sulfatase BDS1-like metallo-beta-lactamase superfamily hydrolase